MVALQRKGESHYTTDSTVTTVNEWWSKTASAILHSVRSELGCIKSEKRMVDKEKWFVTNEAKARIRLEKQLYHKFLASETLEN